jgi:hypothetical protein
MREFLKAPLVTNERSLAFAVELTRAATMSILDFLKKLIVVRFLEVIAQRSGKSSSTPTTTAPF